jgi:hypothetical protein
VERDELAVRRDLELGRAAAVDERLKMMAPSARRQAPTNRPVA